jgi:putative FmdB family regulatory protein
MPLYEYTCDSCHHEFETLVRGREEPNCPECGGSRLHKLFSVPAAHTGGTRELPACEAPRAGGCGLPGCGPMGCGM